VSGLLADACAVAHETVVCRVGPAAAPGEVNCEVIDDGPGVPAEKEGLLFNVLTSTPHGHLGPSLALARRLAGLHGGRVCAGNWREGGFRTVVTLPVEPPPGT
jgi:two-component system sensor histidine kinase KdpD